MKGLKCLYCFNFSVLWDSFFLFFQKEGNQLHNLMKICNAKYKVTYKLE